MIYQIAVLVARTGKVKILPSNALVVVVSPLNALISDQLESCQRLKLKAVKMEQELFDDNREFKQSTTAGPTTAAGTEKVWGEYVSVVC